MRLSEAAAITHGALRGADCRFHGVAIDSRRIRRGDLFVAIAGARRDGHDFVARAGDHGAVGALVADAGTGASADAVTPVPQIAVPDTTAALGQLGAEWRSRFEIPLVAVTGSNGKTTVSAMLAAIFNAGGYCLSPRASFNNQWGVPLTLLRLREHHTHAVIEMGMNHPGEIATLSALARPGVALINNVAPAHLAGLADLQGIADAKAEIFGGLAGDGVAVLNADDQFYEHWLRRIKAGKGRVLSFGVRETADVVAADISTAAGVGTGTGTGDGGGEFELRVGGQSARVRLPVPGRHNVLNAAAAAAAATAAGAGIAQVKAGLESFAAPDGRLRLRAGLNGALVIDDSYNANPASVTAALDVLADYRNREGARVAVLGVMAELGGQSAEFHHQVGAHGRRCGIEHLLCLGPEKSDDLDGYARGFGLQTKRFGELNSLLAHLEPMLAKGVTVLVKGSRAAAMERVVAALVVDAADAKKTNGGAPC